jgi:hypothetical protein
VAKLIDLTGKTYGRLTVISLHSKKPRARWNCICSCGIKKSILANALKAGNVQSCGCLGRTTHITHGESTNGKITKEYGTWRKIKQRCFSKSCKEYLYYGNRGITICNRWLIFANFLDDMGRAPSPKHSIDRIDNNGNYEPINCKWSTTVEQCNNRRTTRIVSYNGVNVPLSLLCRNENVSYNMVRRRIEKGYSIESSIHLPSMTPHQKAKGLTSF